MKWKADVTNIKPWMKKYQLVGRFVALIYIPILPVAYIVLSLKDYFPEFVEALVETFKLVFMPWYDRRGDKGDLI